MTFPRFCRHTSLARATAHALLLDIMERLVIAHHIPGPRRLMELREAEEACAEVLSAIQEAIALEQEAQAPRVARTEDELRAQLQACPEQLFTGRKMPS